MIAAAGLHALDHHVERMVEDHERAMRMANAINAIEGFSVDLDTVETNMVYFDSIQPASQIMGLLSDHSIDVLDIGPNSCRIVVHLHVTDEDVDQVIASFNQLSVV